MCPFGDPRDLPSTDTAAQRPVMLVRCRTGSLRPANQLAIVPNATHMTLAIDPMLPVIVERFLGTR